MSICYIIFSSFCSILMVSSVLNIWLFLVIITLLLLNIQNVAYMFWLLSWFFWSFVNIFSNVGANCNSIMWYMPILTSAVLLLIIMKLYSHFKPWGN